MWARASRSCGGHAAAALVSMPMWIPALLGCEATQPQHERDARAYIPISRIVIFT